MILVWTDLIELSIISTKFFFFCGVIGLSRAIRADIDKVSITSSLIFLTCCSSIDLMVDRGIPNHQHVLSLLCDYTTFKHFLLLSRFTKAFSANIQPKIHSTKFNHTFLFKNHFHSFRKHKRNCIINYGISMKFGRDVINNSTNIKIKKCVRIAQARQV